MEGLPLSEGYGRRMDFYPRDVGRLQLLEPTSAPLVEQIKDYQFFTDVLVLAYGGIRHDPVREYVDARGRSSDAFLYAYERPFLSGLPVDMCRILYGIPHTEWSDFRKFMIMVGGVNHESGQYYQVGAQKVRIADPVFLVKNTVLPAAGCPALDIISFGLNGNFGQLGFAPAKQLPIDCPAARRFPARPDIVKLASALLSGVARPFQAIEPAPLAHGIESCSSS